MCPLGTSCAAPTFAGVVTLLNDLRLAAGKSTLGYLNPLLYSNPSMLTDITQGTNPGCNTNGFEAAPGWVGKVVCVLYECERVCLWVY